MYGVQAVSDLVSRGAELYKHYVPPEWNAYPNALAAGALLVGIVLAFWGHRLLRTIYVLGFMAGGAALGFKIGRTQQIDPLIGLTFGGGVAGFLGYLLYRWWVGVTAAAFAVLLVVCVAWPNIAQLEQDYRDHLVGVSTGDYSKVLTADKMSPGELLKGLAGYAMSERKSFGARFAVAAGMAWLLGMVLGLLLPKFTVVMGTSISGVLVLAGGLGVLLWRNCPDVWRRMNEHPDWLAAALGVALIVSVWKQGRPARAKAPAPAAAPPPKAPPVPAAK